MSVLQHGRASLKGSRGLEHMSSWPHVFYLFFHGHWQWVPTLQLESGGVRNIVLGQTGVRAYLLLPLLTGISNVIYTQDASW